MLPRSAFSVLFLLLVGVAESTHAESVWLVSNGFHTSIGVRTREVAPQVRRLVNDPHADHLLFGWGAAIYYTAPKVTPGVSCRATLLPTASAVHVVPVHGSLARRFAHSDVFRFEVPPQGLERVSQFILESVKRNSTSRPRLLGAGYFPGSRFYAGTEVFWVPITCNIWSARALREAGVRLPMVCAFAAPNLVWLSSKRGVREQSRHPPLDGF